MWRLLAALLDTLTPAARRYWQRERALLDSLGPVSLKTVRRYTQ